MENVDLGFYRLFSPRVKCTRRENFSRTRWESHFLQESQNVISDNADTALKRPTVSFHALWRLWNDGSVLWEKLVCGLCYLASETFLL